METKLCVWRAARCRGAAPKIIPRHRHGVLLRGHKNMRVASVGVSVSTHKLKVGTSSTCPDCRLLLLLLRR